MFWSVYPHSHRQAVPCTSSLDEHGAAQHFQQLQQQPQFQHLQHFQHLQQQQLHQHNQRRNLFDQNHYNNNTHHHHHHHHHLFSGRRTMDTFNPMILDACIRDVGACLSVNQKADLILYALKSISYEGLVLDFHSPSTLSCPVLFFVIHFISICILFSFYPLYGCFRCRPKQPPPIDLRAPQFPSYRLGSPITGGILMASTLDRCSRLFMDCFTFR